MNIAKVSSTQPSIYKNKQSSSVVVEQNKATAPLSASYEHIRQESYQSAYEKIDKINHTDLGLYDEVQRYPERDNIKQLFSLSIYI